MSKRSRGLFLGLLIGALALGGLGWVSNGFTNMDPKAWGDKFKPVVPDDSSSEEEPEEINYLIIEFKEKEYLDISRNSVFASSSLTDGNLGYFVNNALTGFDYSLKIIETNVKRLTVYFNEEQLETIEPKFQLVYQMIPVFSQLFDLEVGYYYDFTNFADINTQTEFETAEPTISKIVLSD